MRDSSLAAYTLTEELHRGRYWVDRAVRRSDSRRVVIKRLNPVAPTSADVARLQAEHALLAELNPPADIPGLVRGIGFVAGTSPLLLMDDVGGYAVSEAAARQPLQLGETLQVVRTVCVALGWLHQNEVMHRDVNPNNIVYNRETQAVELIDFGIATRFGRAAARDATPRDFAGTLPYMAPEHTGRLQIELDHRIDLYSVGATLYELLSGAPPFTGEDTTALTHAILTRLPAPLALAAPGTPTALCNIVHKLLEKDPAARYQSAYGLQHDLERCLDELNRRGTIDPFPLAQRDRNERFVMPDRLFGRQQELSALRAAFDRVKNGARHTVVLDGHSGVGKSALVAALARDVSMQGCLFASGKHEALKQHVPFNAFAQAIGGLVRHMLAAAGAATDRWRERLQTAVGSIGEAAINIAPGLELLLGQQRSLPPLPPREQENRLLWVLQSLVAELCANQPLVLFFDDLQWADVGMLKLLRELVTDTRPCAGLLLIIAARDDDAASDSNLAAVLEHQPDDSSTRLHVRPLGQEAVAEMVHAVVQRGAADLTTVVYRKTGGNAFFVRAFLRHLWDLALLRFDMRDGVWTWDGQAIEALSVADNMADLLLQKQAELPDETRATLEAAACAGDNFPIALIAEGHKIPTAGAVQRLAPAVRAEMLIALEVDPATQEPQRYRFAHDRIRQACYDGIDPARRLALHASLGRAILANSPHMSGAQAFVIAGHLNQCCDILHPDELIGLVGINLAAGKEAKRAASYATARDYLSRARELSGIDNPLRREIDTELADTTYLSGDFDAADVLLDQLISQTPSHEDRCRLQHRRGRNAWAAGQHDKATAIFLRVCRDLGISIPARPTNLHVIPLTLRLYRRVKRLRFEDMTAAPPTDARFDILIELLGDLHTLAFLANSQELQGLAIMHLGLLCIAHNTSAHLNHWLLPMALVVALIGDLALSERLLRHLQNDEFAEADAQPGYTAIVSHFYMDPVACIDLSARYAHGALAVGNIQRALVHIYSGVGLYYIHSTALPCALLELGKAVAGARYDVHDLNMLKADEQGIRCLRGDITPQALLDVMDRDITTPDFAMQQATHRLMVVFCGTLYRTFDLTIPVVQAAPMRASLMQYGFITYAAARYALTAILTLTQAALERGTKIADRGRLRAALKHLTMMARLGPQVYAGLPLLAEAELAQIAGNSAEATWKYARATALLETLGYHDYAALAHECAGRFYLRQGWQDMARSSLSAAHARCAHWGARGKVRALEDEFAFLRQKSESGVSGQRTRSRTATSDGNESSIDLAAVLAASQAVSSEVSIENVVRRMLKSLLETAGADYVALLLKEREVLTVRASQRSGDAQATIPTTTGVGSPEVPERLTRFVSSTMEPVAMAHDDQNPLWQDQYFEHNGALCVLCVPIMQQGKVLGVLYLENSVVREAFSRASVRRVIDVMAAQAAISLANATLYATLEEKVEERTRDLRAAQEKLLEVERDATEGRMAGGFAHEMRNALSAARYLVTEALGDGSDSGPGSNASELEALLDIIECSPLDEERRVEARAHLRTILQNTENLRTQLKGIDASTERAARVTDMIMEYARIREERAAQTSVDLGPLTQRILEELRRELGAVDIDTQIGADCEVRGSEPHYYAMLSNLLLNARDALAETTDDRQRRIRIAVSRSADTVRLEVADNGAGMTAEVQEKLGTPFFSTKGTKGTGLGFGTVKKLVALYNGELDVQSTVGAGTKLTIRLPASVVRSRGLPSQPR